MGQPKFRQIRSSETRRSTQECVRHGSRCAVILAWHLRIERRWRVSWYRVKTFFHVDMDAFFVSVEELYDPSLKGKPVVVGGRPDERGVVSAASYAARKFGVHSAMPLRTAYRMCPQAIFVDGHPERYREYSHKVREVLQAFSPLVEMASIDEAYLDITGTERLYGPCLLYTSPSPRD